MCLVQPKIQTNSEGLCQGTQTDCPWAESNPIISLHLSRRALRSACECPRAGSASPASLPQRAASTPITHIAVCRGAPAITQGLFSLLPLPIIMTALPPLHICSLLFQDLVPYPSYYKKSDNIFFPGSPSTFHHIFLFMITQPQNWIVLETGPIHRFYREGAR